MSNSNKVVFSKVVEQNFQAKGITVEPLIKLDHKLIFTKATYRRKLNCQETYVDSGTGA